ncbi:FecR family protein [Sediminitomix flava]|uniref:FecR family protein n=1 Tax=Sediminitomix flava TaxID=379075 RepID=UPI001B863C7E|nr:FecR domain-containing protein [Sediminitomix flava]
MENKSQFFKYVSEGKKDKDFLKWFYENHQDGEVEKWLEEQWAIADQIPHTFSKEKVWKHIENETSDHKSSISLWIGYRNIAAILLPLLCALGILGYVLNESSNVVAPSLSHIVVPEGGRSHIVLPDQTEVWLNGGSSLTYANAFEGSERLVELKGEGFFDVTHNPKQPFLVKVEDVEIKVLGTSFNVLQDSEKGSVTSTLVEGKIAAQLPNKDEAVVLKPGQQLNFDRKRKGYWVKNVDVNLFTSWRHGRLELNAIKLSEAVKHLSKKYNKTIKIKDSEIADERLTADLSNEDLYDVLDLLEATLQLSYKEENNEIILMKK